MTAYRTTNILFFILITLVFLYSFVFFPNNHPVQCIYKNKTGVDCPSCGTSRLFSLMLRGCYSEAVQINKNSARLFFFFFTQWLWRGCVFIFFDKVKFLKTKTAVMIDATLSLVWLLFSVVPFYFT